MALNLSHNIEKIIDGNPYFLCFSTASWFSKVLSWFSKIFHSTLLSLAHRNILFHVILVHHHHLDQVPCCQAINSNNFDLYFYCSPYVSFSCSHQSYKRNKNKVFEFFLLLLKLLILSVWKFCLNYSNLATHSHAANTQCAKTYTKAVGSLSRVNIFDFEQVFAN